MKPAEDKNLQDIGDDEAGPMTPGLDVYQPKERFIFCYFNGEKMIRADPLVLYRRIQAKAGDLDADITAANFPGYDKAEEAHSSLDASLRGIFKIKSLDDGGLTSTELEDLLTQFMDYCEWAKKKWNAIPMPQTATSASSDSSSKDASPTSNFLDSGSTKPAPSTAVPPPSPSAPASPSAPSTQAWRIGTISPMEQPLPGT